MEMLIERCAALDIHKDSLVAAVRVPEPGGRREQLTHTFRTTTAGLLALRDWLEGFGVTVVGMESTGVYWRPVYYLLEERFECWLLNAQHLRHVPGRKSDVQDAAWICQLVEHGLVRPSFVPPRPQRELRDLTRYRKAQIEERTREVQRLDKVLQEAGIKLSSVASKVLSVSGRAMLDALLAGTNDPEALAELARGRLRQKLPALREALAGRFSGNHALLVSQILAHVDFLDQAIATLSARIEQQLAPFAAKVEPLDTILGVDRRAAEVILAEIGPDLTRFPSHRHLASWAGLCPGLHESAGKRKSGRTRNGSKWLSATLADSAKAAARTTGTYLAAHNARIKGRRGASRATIATAHAILVSAYHMLTRNLPHDELGDDYFHRRERERADRYTRRLVRQLERLRHRVTLEPTPEAA